MLFYKRIDDNLEFINKMKGKIKFKIFKVVKFMAKTRVSHLLLSITFNEEFEDLILAFYI